MSLLSSFPGAAFLFFPGGGGESVTVSPDEVAGWDVRALVGVLVDSVLDGNREVVGVDCGMPGGTSRKAVRISEFCCIIVFRSSVWDFIRSISSAMGGVETMVRSRVVCSVRRVISFESSSIGLD